MPSCSPNVSHAAACHACQFGGVIGGASRVHGTAHAERRPLRRRRHKLPARLCATLAMAAA
eukprot:1095042-Prymnesium_polylepis.3